MKSLLSLLAAATCFNSYSQSYEWAFPPFDKKVVSYANRFSGGLARIDIVAKDSKSGQLHGYINKTGAWVISPTLDAAGDFREGIAYARVKFEQGYGFINTKGEWVIQPQYKDTDDFSEGLAAVEINGKWYFIDKTGKLAFPQGFDKYTETFRDIKISVDNYAFHEGLCAIWQNGFWGYINKQGVFAIKPAYTNVYPFVNGFARVVQNGKIGFIDKTGQYLIQPILDKAWDFNNGYALIYDKTNPERVIADTRGKLYTASEMKTLKESSDNYVSYKDKSGYYGFFDRNSKVTIYPSFVGVSKFKEGVAAAKMGKRWGFIDSTGSWIMDTVITKNMDGFTFSEGLCAVLIDDQWGYIKNPLKAALALSAEFAANETWYIKNEPIIFGNKTFVKYGLPRVLGSSEITKCGNYKKAGVYIESGKLGVHEIIYVLVRKNEYQPYQIKK